MLWLLHAAFPSTRMLSRKPSSLTPFNRSLEDPAPASPFVPTATSNSSVAQSKYHNPFTQMLLNSGVALGGKVTLCGAICISTAMLALDRSTTEILKANLWLVAAVFCFVALSAVWQMVALNFETLKTVQNAWNELRTGKDLNGDGVVGMPTYEQPREPIERVVDLVPHNNAPTKTVIESGKVKIDRRDFLAFLYRAWETNGVPEQGTSRIYWIGGRKKDGSLSKQFTFERSDGSTQLCTREYYDAIVNKLDAIGEMEARMPGLSGTLKRDPKIWIGETKWL